jgi:hypothetical protein
MSDLVAAGALKPKEGAPAKPASLRAGLFMIACPARVGSSMLVNALQTHPSIVCHMEIFNPARIGGFWGSYRDRLASESELEERLRTLRERDPSSFLYKIAFDPQQRSHVGFKFKFDELLMPAFAGARTILSQDTDIKVIFLTRWNLLRRYVSHARARQTGVMMRTERDERPAMKHIRVDPKACREDMEATFRRQNFVRTMFREHDMLQITYEDLVGPDRNAAFNRILLFLGVEPRPLRTVHAKLGHDDLACEIENLSELRVSFSATPFAEFFI